MPGIEYTLPEECSVDQLEIVLDALQQARARQQDDPGITAALEGAIQIIEDEISKRREGENSWNH